MLLLTDACNHVSGLRIDISEAETTVSGSETAKSRPETAVSGPETYILVVADLEPF